MTHGFTNFSLSPVRVALIAWALAILPGVATAQPRCSTLEGSYAFTASGTFPIAGPPSVFAPFSVIGIQTFETGGTFTLTESGTFPGSVLRSARLSGTYTLNPNCTGTMVLKFPDGTISTQDFVVANGGKTLYGVGVDAGPVGASLVTTFTKLTPAP